ncbi:SDR family oxidoreductase [Streptosporangium sp. NPDC023615]|uniref:SDR family NAD(P)-dependent oxidoreductase n=1 Tax=Streptosporangium sp. NPDC023615 TaxID=3154794 RepID=UPI0034363D6D
MDLQLSGKKAVVTAAGGGIGGQVVRTLIAEGATVLGADIEISPALKESGALTVQADLTAPEGVERLRQAAESELGQVDILVNLVGGLTGLPVASLGDIDDAAWQRAFELNLFSTVRVTRTLLDLLRESVVNLSSSVARWPSTGPHWYGTSKAAVTVLGKGLAEELAPRGIRVNTVSAGLIRTPLWDEYAPRLAKSYGFETDDFIANLPALAQVALGRWGKAEDVANLIVFLSSPAAGFITGGDYVIDGGAEKIR